MLFCSLFDSVAVLFMHIIRILTITKMLEGMKKKQMEEVWVKT